MFLNLISTIKLWADYLIGEIQKSPRKVCRSCSGLLGLMFAKLYANLAFLRLEMEL